MSQRINIAISQLQNLSIPSELGPRTLDALSTSASRKRISSFAIASGALLLCTLMAVAFFTPKNATARAVESIQSAMDAKVRHSRMFMSIEEHEILSSERWDHSNLTRRDNYLPEYQPVTLRMFSKPTGKSILVESVVTDGKRLLRLVHKEKRASLESYSSKDVNSGFDLDSVLRDMGARQNLSAVDIKTSVIGEQQVLVARFANKLADYTIYCDEKTRLPFKMEVVSRPLFPGDEAQYNNFFYSFFEDVDARLFSMDIPAGYRLSTEMK